MVQLSELEIDFLSKFHNGECFDAYNYLGYHLENDMAVFRVWAPNAKEVYLMCDANGWDDTATPLEKISDGGVWRCEMPKMNQYDNYKYSIITNDGQKLFKADPYAFHAETRPGTASKIYDLPDFKWTDKNYVSSKKRKKLLEQPINIYEVHIGSWKRYEDKHNYDYRKLASELIPYVKEMGYTHIELMPVSEYPFDGSWGYQVTGYYAPTSRYGTPDDFMYFIDCCHKEGIGVILDWVAAHFPKDACGLYEFDGSCCYEYSDPLKNEHPDWGTRIFDYGRYEVISFLVSNAAFWIDKYHIDGIRVDAVASMLYLDYGKQGGEWRPNMHGSNENLEAIEFLKTLNRECFNVDKSVLMIAEESTAWPNVTKPDFDGGLGFNMKWNMGWMNDILSYMSTNPFFRKDHHSEITFSLTYAFSENYVLPLSHDEVVHGKCSLISKMPGEGTEKFDNLRAFYAYYMAHPGKKLLFMGGELGQFIEWNFATELDWFLLEYPSHKALHNFVKDLNHFYVENPQLWQVDYSWEGFYWLCVDDNEQNIIAFSRKDKANKELFTFCNFSPVERKKYRIGVPHSGEYSIIFTSDMEKYGGKTKRRKTYLTEAVESHGFKQSIVIELPGMSTMFMTVKKGKGKEPKAKTTKVTNPKTTTKISKTKTSEEN